MSHQEFLAALNNVYVRTNEEDGSKIDTRDERVAELAKAEVTGETLALMEPSDLAAMLSGSVYVPDGIKVQKIVNAAEVTKASQPEPAAAELIMGRLHDLSAKGDLPLTAKDKHPANAVMAKLLSTPEGCYVYLDIAKLLMQAHQEDVPNVCRPPKKVKVDALITAPMDPEAQPLSNEGDEGSMAWASN